MKTLRDLWTRKSAEPSKSDRFVFVDKPIMTAHNDIPAVFKIDTCNALELFEVTVDQLQSYYSNGDLSAVDYVQFCLENIRKTNPYLQSVIETNPDAVSIAQALDQERRDGHIRGPLHGIPVLVKDNIATADKMETTAGSFALLGCKVPKDAHIVQRLRQAGAIIIGKSNMDEWAGMCARKCSCGWSARGGQCRNPYILSRSPHGSSSGSAVAVSANLVPISIGTETDCSIISPAMVNGVVGIKPTVGLTSRTGVIPVSETQDTVGAFGRTVADAVVALDAIVGLDTDDKYTTDPARLQPKTYATCLVDRSSLKGAKFGLPMRRFWETAPRRQRKLVEFVLHLMTKAGAKIYEVDMPCVSERLAADGEWDYERYGSVNPSASEATVLKIQTCYLMDEYLSGLTNTPMRSLSDIIDYSDANSGSEGGLPNIHPAFPVGFDFFRECVATKGIQSPEYHAALNHITSQCRENGIDAALKHKCEDGREVELEALLFCDVKRGGIQIAAQAGYPMITIPVGLDPDGMPVSIVLAHSAWQEERIIKWASAIEDLLRDHMQREMRRNNVAHMPRNMRRGRVPPTFKNHFAKNIPVEECYTYPAMSQMEDNEAMQPHDVHSLSGEIEGGDLEEWQRSKYLV